MNKKPLLIFPQAETLSKLNKGRGASNIHLPSYERQRERLSPQFEQLEQNFEAQRPTLQDSAAGAAPEQVLVLEPIDSVPDFLRAVKTIPGMEWLAEWEDENIEPNEDFYDEKNREKKLKGKLFLIMTNQQAMHELLSLWHRFNENRIADLGRGRAKWREMFSKLRNIRFWDVEDRFEETGALEEWKERVVEGQENIRFEAEIWYRGEPDQRQEATNRFETFLSEEGGRLISQCVIEEIKYHGVLAELPIGAIQTVLENQNVQWVRCSNVMFFRPLGQSVVTMPIDEPLAGGAIQESSIPLPQGDPVVALLDGLPLENHNLLRNHLVIDDPDGRSTDYQAEERLHGTAMASLILHGELDTQGVPLSRPIYVRPILRPDQNDWKHPRTESIPDDVLPVDLIHRAVRRLFDGEGTVPAVARQVRIINLSIGDPCQLFNRSPSTWARLLDWLASYYKVLFIISAGNHFAEIKLAIERPALSSLTPEQLQKEVILAIHRDSRNRRLLAPAESVNALTVGALHTDASVIGPMGNRIDIYQDAGLPSPINALGLGLRRSVKPEILIPGGRQLYQEVLGTHSNATLQINNSSVAPGQLVASPGKTPGDLNARRYCRGTSNAAAMTTRLAAVLHDSIHNLRQEAGGDLLQDRYLAVLIKTLLVHGASWGEIDPILRKALEGEIENRAFREHASRFLGYGAVDSDRVLFCTDQRATLIGCNSIKKGQGHIYKVPLPASLSGQKVWRRLGITLAWFTPINPSHRAYRCADLWFTPLNNSLKELLKIKGQETDRRTAQRGTVQHEVCEGDSATAFMQGAELQIQVSCREDAQKLAETEEILYAICVTLEVAENTPIPLYEEIRSRIRTAIRPSIQGS